MANAYKLPKPVRAVNNDYFHYGFADYFFNQTIKSLTFYE